jgi:hypothetical protein
MGGDIYSPRVSVFLEVPEAAWVCASPLAFAFREPVVAGASNVCKCTLDLSAQEAGQDHVGVIAELASVDVALAGNELESPSEPAGDYLFVQPVSQPADRGHPSGILSHRESHDRTLAHQQGARRRTPCGS